MPGRARAMHPDATVGGDRDLPEGQRGAEVRRAERDRHERRRATNAPSMIARSRITLTARLRRARRAARPRARPRRRRRSCSASQRSRRAPAAERAQPALAVLGREVGQRAGAPRAQAPRGQVEPRAVLVERVDELVDALDAARARRPRRPRVSRDPSERSAACRSRRVRIAISPRSAFVTTSTSGISMIPDFRNCSTSPQPGCTTTATVSATSATSVSAWPDADGLDHDDVERRGQRLRRGARGRRQAAEPLAGGRRADEHAAVARVEVDPRAVAEQRRRPSGARTGRRRARRRCGRAAPGARRSAREQRRLARAGRAGDADDVPGRLAAERGGGDRAQQRGDLRAVAGVAALDEVQHGRARPRRSPLAQARAERSRRPRLSSAAGRGAAATPLRSATSATMSRMMRVMSKSFGRVDRGDAGVLQRRRRRRSGMIPPTTTGASTPASRSARHDVRDQLAVRAREDREADDVDALLQRRRRRSARASGGCPRRRRPCPASRARTAICSAPLECPSRPGLPTRIFGRPPERLADALDLVAHGRRARRRRRPRRPRRRRSGARYSPKTSRSAPRPLAGRGARAGGGDRRGHEVLVGRPRRARSSSSAASTAALVALGAPRARRPRCCSASTAGVDGRGCRRRRPAVSGDGSVSVKRLRPTTICSPRLDAPDAARGGSRRARPSCSRPPRPRRRARRRRPSRRARPRAARPRARPSRFEPSKMSGYSSRSVS